MGLMLVGLEYRCYLKSTRTGRHVVAMYRHRKAAFSVDEPNEPHRMELVDPGSFLLIVPTRRIVTVHLRTVLEACDTNW